MTGGAKPSSSVVWLAMLSGLPAGLSSRSPTLAELASYAGFHAAVARGDLAGRSSAVSQPATARRRWTTSCARRSMSPCSRRSTTPHGFSWKLGANPNRVEADRYEDIVTIAAVANDVPMLKIACAA